MIAPLGDDTARRLARELFDRPLLLEAGAGTGKTSALVARLLAWTLDIGWRERAERLAERASAARRPAPTRREIAADLLDGIVAITFTEAAAAEMAARLGSALAQVGRGEQPAERTDLALDGELRERAAALLEELGRARIQTIHSFCRALLAAHPFEAGLHPAFRIDADSTELERVTSDLLRERGSERLRAGDPDWLALFAEDRSPERLFAALLRAAESSVAPELLERDPFPSSAVEVRLDESRRALEPLRAALAAVAPKLRKNAVAHRVLAALDALLVELRGSGDVLDALESAALGAERLLAESGDTLRDWSADQTTESIGRLLPSDGVPFCRLASNALAALGRLEKIRPAALARVRRVVGPLLFELRKRLRREGIVLYEDLLERAYRLLAERVDVLATVRRGIRQLLVDEFQDTDWRQCALVEKLALEGQESERPGLFVVGDPKQSIYGWRHADLEAYQGFLARADGAGAVRARLEVNFRSLPAILAEVERAVAPHLVAEPGLQPPFERLVPSPRALALAERIGARPAVEYWLSTSAERGNETGASAASRIEARALVSDLLAQRHRDSTLRWSDVALLTRSATDLETYLQALREAAIPFAVERDRSYWRRREVIDAAALVRTIVDPGDHLALVTFLRSPFVGVPDAALLPLWRERLPERVDALMAPDPLRIRELEELLGRVASGLPAGVPGLERIDGWEASALFALEALAELRARWGREPAQDFVERLRSRIAFEPTTAARFLGRFGLANLERFFADLEEALEGGGDDPASIVRFLRRAVAERRVAEEALPPESDAEAVRVMTIHRAKGLEFRHVYLLQVQKGTDRGGEESPFSSAGGAGGAIDYQLLGLRTLGWADIAERRKRVSDRERARLLYVALTRAKERLVIAGHWFARHGRERSLLPLFAARIETSPFAESASGVTTVPTLDAHGVLWRAPAHEPSWSDEIRATVDAAAIQPDDPAHLVRDLDRLAARRATATARASRSRLQRASDFVAFEPGEGEAQELVREGKQIPALARARGLALHRALELFDLAQHDEGAWRSAVEAVYRAERALPSNAEIAALAEALEGLKLSLLWKQLSSLRPQILARELPLLVAADPSAVAGPIDGYVGALDLLYQDPGTAELVVADFKSDEIESDEEIPIKVEAYRPQLELYGRAVSSNFSLLTPPRLELWLLGLDRIVVVSPTARSFDSG